MASPPVLIGLILSFMCILCAAEEDLNEKKYNHAYVLQDLETYQTPSTLQDSDTNRGSYYISTPSPVNYNNNPYLPRPKPPSQNSLPASPGLAPDQAPSAPATAQPLPPVVHAAPASSNNNGYMDQSPVVPNGNIYGPHLYSAPTTTYSGPQISYSDLQNSPVLIVVKNPTTLSYDVAYASTGLGNLDRDTNSQLIAKLLLRHSDKVGIIYPTNSFPINAFPDFPISNLILPQDMGLAKMFNFYPRYIPIMFLMNTKGYQKVARDTTLTHLGQYKYE